MIQTNKTDYQTAKKPGFKAKWQAFWTKRWQKWQSNLALGATNEANIRTKPLAYFQPINNMKWKMIGKTFDYQNTLYLDKPSKALKEFIFRYAQSFGGVIGMLILITVVLMAFIIPFTTLNPNTIDVTNRNLTFDQTGNNGIYHILGTDELGRDVWARLWHGLRFSLALSFVVAFFEVILGVTIGISMGQFDKFDKLVTFFIKIISVVPTILILILITIITAPSFWIIVFALSLTGWTSMANQIRAQVKRAKNFEWVAASKVLGTPTWKVLKNYVPVIIPILITQLIFTIPGVILAETGLAFIGLAINDIPTLGNLISDGQKLFPTYLRYVFVPSFILVLLITSIQLIGASIQDALRRQR